MHQQSSRATSDTESTRVYKKATNRRQIIRHIHRQRTRGLSGHRNNYIGQTGT